MALGGCVILLTLSVRRPLTYHSRANSLKASLNSISVEFLTNRILQMYWLVCVILKPVTYSVKILDSKISFRIVQYLNAWIKKFVFKISIDSPDHLVNVYNNFEYLSKFFIRPYRIRQNRSPKRKRLIWHQWKSLYSFLVSPHYLTFESLVTIAFL